jgi:hypothetical protein
MPLSISTKPKRKRRFREANMVDHFIQEAILVAITENTTITDTTREAGPGPAGWTVIATR